MRRWTAGTAAVAWLLGRIVLGSRWDGVEIAPGLWRDSVGLWQWAILWLLLAGLAIGVAARLTRWSHRMVALVPLLCWIAWSLREGTLGPLPVVIYGLPTLVAWCGPLLAHDALRRRA